jgi:hypothetical protein
LSIQRIPITAEKPAAGGPFKPEMTTNDDISRPGGGRIRVNSITYEQKAGQK